MTGWKKAVLAVLLLFICLPAAFAANDTAASGGTPDAFQAAGALYTKSVDLAEAGNYTGALQVADQALAYNQSSLTALIQAHRSGVLVALKRYDEAVTAADAAIAVQGNLTVAHSVAYYNKGNALFAEGKTALAQAAFEKAHELDSSLPVPAGLTSAPEPTKSPLPPVLALVAGISGLLLFRRVQQR